MVCLRICVSAYLSVCLSVVDPVSRWSAGYVCSEWSGPSRMNCFSFLPSTLKTRGGSICRSTHRSIHPFIEAFWSVCWSFGQGEGGRKDYCGWVDGWTGVKEKGPHLTSGFVCLRCACGWMDGRTSVGLYAPKRAVLDRYTDGWMHG